MKVAAATDRVRVPPPHVLLQAPQAPVVHDDALIAALEDGVDARVLRETGRVGRYAFTHALVRATLYDGLSRLVSAVGPWEALRSG